ncbi:MAG: hypothetical protein Q7R95_00015 [bacterium]|nr:hypothetical protein [bacterium]
MICKDCNEILIEDEYGRGYRYNPFLQKYYTLSRNGGKLYFCGKTGKKHIPKEVEINKCKKCGKDLGE